MANSYMAGWRRKNILAKTQERSGGFDIGEQMGRTEKKKLSVCLRAKLEI